MAQPASRPFSFLLCEPLFLLSSPDSYSKTYCFRRNRVVSRSRCLLLHVFPSCDSQFVLWMPTSNSPIIMLLLFFSGFSVSLQNHNYSLRNDVLSTAFVCPKRCSKYCTCWITDRCSPESLRPNFFSTRSHSSFSLFDSLIHPSPSYLIRFIIQSKRWLQLLKPEPL